MTYIDYFGLVADINEGLQACACGYCVRGEGFCHCMGSDPTHNIGTCLCRGISCIHKRGGSIVKVGSNIASSLSGIGHGIVDFVIGSSHDLQTAAVYMGAGELELTLQERVRMIKAVEQSQANQMATIEGWMMDMLSIDPSDAVYQSFRSTTTLGLEVGSLVAGGYGAVKGVMAFSKIAKAPTQITKIAKLSTKQLKSSNGFFGSKGFELKNPKYQKIRNNPTTIQGRSYGSHALDQMQNRGFTPSVVEETIQNGVSVPNIVTGRMQFYDPVNNISVVTEDGKIVTAMYGRLN